VYRTVSLLVYTFGLAAFLGLFALWVRQRRLTRPKLTGWIYPAIFLTSAAWFSLNLFTPDYLLLLAAACAFPPLLGKLFGVRGLPALSAASVAVAVATVPFAAARAELSAAYCVLLAGAGSAAIAQRSTSRPRALLLGGATLLVPAALFAPSDWLSLAMRSLPLTLLLADSYTRRRFLFLDLFVKWGSYFVLSLIAVAIWFRAVPETLPAVPRALLLLPVLWAVPRLCRALGGYLDRRLLGRPYTATAAQRLFLERLQLTTGEAALRVEAELVLAEIFQTRVVVAADGTLQLDDRPDGRPVFSEDLELLRTLHEMYTFLRENRRLEALKRDFSLKALRAQINPHFLFNALNTVAGLIPSDPALAEQTVEKLAEVFRYTLKRSESEMAPLGEELDFLRAWLDVQQARFGARLAVRIDAPLETLSVRIPALALQTLVENAMKHGVARSSQPCAVTIQAGREGEYLRLAVTDSGPGPIAPEHQDGHGLRNVRERLAGYYGGRASLELARDELAGLTTATLEIPL
jgi:signal transduction histidine kinase